MKKNKNKQKVKIKQRLESGTFNEKGNLENCAYNVSFTGTSHLC
jgi:hypothetical protein